MAKKQEQGKDIRILIAPFGWVFVGVYSLVAQKVEHEDGTPAHYETLVRLTNASVIRRWGTQKGLGQLTNGPLKETVLDPCGIVEVHLQTVVSSIRCESRWNF